jgi:2',3'-cyclic-nucleotide 2'-phosphodiesterase (5'-nucleotidase family)
MANLSIRILHTNDLHGSLSPSKVDLIAPYRAKCDLYFDSGDCVKAGNLTVPLKPESVWTQLADLQCTASVPGNRESHVIRTAFDAKLAGHSHPILCANLYDKVGDRILPPTLSLEVKGLRVGILGVMVPMVTQKMASKAVSQLMWTQPIPEAVEAAAGLRKVSDLVIALTHIGFRQDQALAEATGDIDLILGGHSHTILDQPLQVGSAWICQAGSHGQFCGEYAWTLGAGVTEARLIPLE